MPNVSAFMAYILLTTFTPGPNNIICMTNAGKYGFVKSITFNIGVFFGFLIILLASTALSTFLYEIMPKIKTYMTFIGFLYILRLAWKVFKSDRYSNSAEITSDNSFLSGLLLQFINPKVILFSMTAVSTFIIPYYESATTLCLFSVFLSFVGFCATCSWSVFGAVFKRFFEGNKRIINLSMSLLLVYCAVSLYL